MMINIKTIKEKIFLNKRSPFKYIYFFINKIISIFAYKKSFSQGSMDLILEHIFKDKNNGFYVDVGCQHPIKNNNTYLLYKRGWSGINIDLDFNSIEMFNYFRPDDDNQKIALSDKKSISNLYFFHNRAPKNTLSKNNSLGAKKILKINTDTLDNVIKKSKLRIKEIDFLSVDVEGNEFNVLKGLNFKRYKPKVICLELINKNKNFFYEQKIEDIQKSKIYKFMIKRKYKLANWIHDDLIFISNSLLKK